MDSNHPRQELVADASPHSVLVVDDDLSLREMIACALQQDGRVVSTVPNGIAALEFLDRHRVDVILMDVYMPGLSGLEVVQMWRTRLGGSEVPIVLMTGSYGDTQSEIPTGWIQGTLHKPFRLAELRHLVTQIINVGGSEFRGGSTV